MLAVALGMSCAGCAVDNPLFGMSDGEDGGFGTTDGDDVGDDDGPTDGTATEGDPDDDGDPDPDGTAGVDGGTDGDPDAGDDDDDDDDDDDGRDGGFDDDSGDEDTGPPPLDDDGGETGDELACPQAVTLYSGSTFTGRIEYDGSIGYEAAQANCEARLENLAPGTCEDNVVFAVLRDGPAENGTVDFAEFLGVVHDTPVRGPNGALVIWDAVEFFDGSLDATLWEAGVFPGPTHVWSGFDPNQLHDNCEDWTADAGVMSGGVGDSAHDYKWSSTGNFGCNTVQPILCACF